jgi:hypothetical protein
MRSSGSTCRWPAPRPGTWTTPKAEQAAELGLAQAVLAWRHPSGQGFDRAATTAIVNHLQQGRTRTVTPYPPADPTGT